MHRVYELMHRRRVKFSNRPHYAQYVHSMAAILRVPSIESMKRSGFIYLLAKDSFFFFLSKCDQ